jgi:hypothetical protein
MGTSIQLHGNRLYDAHCTPHTAHTTTTWTRIKSTHGPKAGQTISDRFCELWMGPHPGVKPLALLSKGSLLSNPRQSAGVRGTRHAGAILFKYGNGCCGLYHRVGRYGTRSASIRTVLPDDIQPDGRTPGCGRLRDGLVASAAHTATGLSYARTLSHRRWLRMI